MQTLGENIKDLVEPDALSSMDKEHFRQTRDKFILSEFGNLFRHEVEKRFPRRVIMTTENKLLVLQAMHDSFGHCGIDGCSQLLKTTFGGQ
ncbi:hypothetical protein V1517DRAFT_342125, partial [Lipomyces orientalis]